MEKSLSATKFIDADHPSVIDFVKQHTDSQQTDKQKAIALYHIIRDKFFYDPYRIDFSEEGLKASHTLTLDYGWCVSKAILLTACCRASGIPSKLGFADVRNHLSTDRMRAAMKTDVFYWHGYSVIYLEGKWIKATPAFNKELCEKFSLKTLEFDGENDSIYHPFSKNGQRHMEYLNQRGEFNELPFQAMMETFSQKYNFSLNVHSQHSFNNDINKEIKTGAGY